MRGFTRIALDAMYGFPFRSEMLEYVCGWAGECGLISLQDCRCELSGDYFDFNGRPYCERHALRMIRGVQNGNGNGNGNLGASRTPANMERRRTRLMFM